MADMGRMLMMVGGAIFMVGVLIHFGGRLPWFGNLPGDVVVERDGFTLFAPIGTMIVLSRLLTLVLNVVARMLR